MIKIVRKKFKLIYKFFQYLYIFSWNEVMQGIDIFIRYFRKIDFKD